MLVINYVLFAAIATLVNIAFQEISLVLYDKPFALELSLLVGTLAGLVTKYLLDKRYIFQVGSTTASQGVKMFYLYTFFGGFTTLFFWGMELLADSLSGGDKTIRYSAGALALAIGYWAKYNLDKRFVFKTAVSLS